MGVRLVRYTRSSSGLSDARDHDELINKDLMNQHPIYAITGLQEVLNILEDSIYETNVSIIEKTNNILTDIENITNTLEDIANFNVINNVEETNTVKLDYDETTKTLKGDVKIYESEKDNNVIIKTDTGLYVPKIITDNTNTIDCNIETKNENLDKIFNNGLVFSHVPYSDSNIYESSEANAWYWDNDIQSAVVQSKNSTYTFTGFVTQNFYDNYTHTATIKSTSNRNNLNGLVVGFVFDEEGKPHTLSIVCSRNSSTVFKWALIYNYKLHGRQELFSIGNGPNGTIPSGSSETPWPSSGGITINVTKHGNLVTCTCSNWGETTLNELTKISIDLNDYSWGHLFTGKVRVGYCSQIQPYSYFSNITFLSDSTPVSQIFTASVKVSQEEDNALRKLEDGLYVKEYISSKAVTQASHGFTIGDFIYYHPFDKYQKSLAIDNYDSNIVGMVTKVIDADNFEYQWSGFYKTDIFNNANGFIQGMPLYISDTEPGKTTQEQPDISKTVGYPVENIGLIISIERGIQYNQEASIGDFKTSANTYNVRSDGFIKVIDGIDYKQTLIEKLLKTLSEEFKTTYMVFNNTLQTVQFINSNELYTINKVPDGLNLFIKAF